MKCELCHGEMKVARVWEFMSKWGTYTTTTYECKMCLHHQKDVKEVRNQNVQIRDG